MTARAPHLEFAAEGGRFPAGEPVRGIITLPAHPPVVSAGAHVQWYTEGKGTPEEGPEIPAEVAPAGEGPGGTRRFSFEVPLPLTPLSYDGTIVKIRWRLVVRVAIAGQLPVTHPYDFTVVAPPDRGATPYRA